MCSEESVNLQRGMNYKLGGTYSVVLMSIRPNAPYNDRVEEDGKILIYEGHDIPKQTDLPDPKKVNQPMYYDSGKPTQNGHFFLAAKRYREGKEKAVRVKVYEKIRPGIWAYNGIFALTDAWEEESNQRNVFKYRLELSDNQDLNTRVGNVEIAHQRIIPTSVKQAVWKRDQGKCIKCGSTDNLHFDHIIPFSKGGSSLVAENIQILCARHNLEKRDRID